MTTKKDDIYFLKQCHDLALKSYRAGDHPTGSLIVLKNKIISKSENYAFRTGDPTLHAEACVIKKALKQRGLLKNCTLYSSLEPCVMCSYLIRETGISRVVFSIKAPITGGETGWGMLKDKRLLKLKPIFTDPPSIAHVKIKSKLQDTINSWVSHYNPKHYPLSPVRKLLLSLFGR